MLEYTVCLTLVWMELRLAPIHFWRDSVNQPASAADLSAHLFWPFPPAQCDWVARTVPRLPGAEGFKPLWNMGFEILLVTTNLGPLNGFGPFSLLTLKYVKLPPIGLRLLAWCIQRYGGLEPPPFPFPDGL